MLKLFVKAVRAHLLYLPNNPTYQRSIEVLRAAFLPIWDQVDYLALKVSEDAFTYNGEVVMVEEQKSSDNLPWNFYKDGVRELRFHRDFELEELNKLLDILQRVRKASPEEDDLLTMLWEGEFIYLRYQYVDLALEPASPLEPGDPLEVVRRKDDEEEVSPNAVRQASSTPTSTEVVNMADFDSSLYFLDDREIDYLQSAVKAEYLREHRTNVVTILLDIFELQTARNTREEILSLLESFVLHLLSGGRFGIVAYLLRELATTGTRARDLDATIRERLNELPARLSEGETLSQMLQALDESSDLPPQEDLTELFEQLRPTALQTVFAWVSRLQTPRLRSLLEEAAGRLASANTAELVRLVTSTDPTVAIEAIRRSGALKTPAAVVPLGKVLQEPDAQLRLAAVQALTDIGSAGALQVLERAVDDTDRDIRVATARALAAKAYRPALARLENAVKGKQLRERDLTEKMAMFEAYGSLCGDGGIGLLDGILNSKGFLGRREDPELRACAARALGRIGTPKAQESLRQSSNDKEIIVRNAVNQAMRGEVAR